MALSISLPSSMDMIVKIGVFGVGGAGNNAVNNMIASNLEGVDFWAANTDAQALDYALTGNRIQLGATSTKGLGAGSHPEVGKLAAEESLSDILSAMENLNMVFITAGMGGGTGTGAAPVIAKAAKEKNILTVGVVTKPFHFEGMRRMKVAELGLEEMQKYVDTLIVIPNQNLFRIANEKTTFADAFKLADNVLHSGVRGITDLITMPGLINLDFADIRTVMSEMGKAMMGTGEAEGENRATKASENAISNPLLDNSSMKGAQGVLINITGGTDMTLFEVDEAANRIREEVDSEANIIFGSAFNADLEGKIRVSVVATGIDAEHFMKKAKAEINSQKAETIVTKPQQQVDTTSYATDPEANEDEVASTNNPFIAPKPVEPEEFEFQNLVSENEAQLDDNDLSEDQKMAYEQTSDKSKETKSFSLFSKVTSSFAQKPSSNDGKTQNQPLKEDLFDIPAFLRRKGNQ